MSIKLKLRFIQRIYIIIVPNCAGYLQKHLLSRINRQIYQ